MKTVTVEQFLRFGPFHDEDKVRAIAGKRKRWTALQVLALDDVPAEDRLWAVLREEFIDAPILHEFACWCANEALKLVPKPDPRSVAAIEVKRRWLHGDATDKELDAASAAAWVAARAAASAATSATARDAAWSAAWSASAAASNAARDAAWVASDAASDAASATARDAAWSAAWAASAAASAASAAASAAARDASDAARAAQVKTLIALLKGTDGARVAG